MESTEEKIQQMQLLEQNLQNFLMQRQQFQLQLIEIESALDELKGKEDAYKIVGSIMVLTKADSIRKELEEKKSTLDIRISSLEKQESRIRDKTGALRKEVLEAIQNKKEN